jgi:hypothetical protein
MTELMPIIFGPRWLQNMSQPIAVQNVIDYLMCALEDSSGQGQVFEIGGPDRMVYSDLMLTYGRLRGLHRTLVTLPGIPLWFMSMGVAVMTPVPASIARPLVDGLGSDSLVQDETARDTFPNVNLIGYEEAVNLSLDQLRPDRLEPTWTDCDRPVKFMKHEGFFIDHNCEKVNATPEKVFKVISSMGGENGWLYANWLWKLRGWLDRIVGGPGMRGRKGALKVGDILDCYRIEALEEDRLLRLYSELKVSGEGWMEWRVETENGVTRVSQTGFFAPRGFWGFAYWIILSPFHRLVFRGLINAIVRRSEAEN